MRELSLHILDIVQNSLAAGAGHIYILVNEDYTGDICTIEIQDDGCGMSEVDAIRAVDPFYTTRKTRKVGLGLSLLKANAEASGGRLAVKSFPGEGTTIKAFFQQSHLDKPPLGDMASTIMALLGGHPKIEFIYEHRCGDKTFIFSTSEAREILKETSIDNPEILLWIKEYINEKEKKLYIENCNKDGTI